MSRRNPFASMTAAASPPRKPRNPFEATTLPAATPAAAPAAGPAATRQTKAPAVSLPDRDHNEDDDIFAASRKAPAQPAARPPAAKTAHTVQIAAAPRVPHERAGGAQSQQPPRQPVPRSAARASTTPATRAPAPSTASAAAATSRARPTHAALLDDDGDIPQPQQRQDKEEKGEGKMGSAFAFRNGDGGDDGGGLFGSHDESDMGRMLTVGAGTCSRGAVGVRGAEDDLDATSTDVEAQSIFLSDAHADEHDADNFFDAAPESPQGRPQAATPTTTTPSTPTLSSAPDVPAASIRMRFRPTNEWDGVDDPAKLRQLLHAMVDEQDALRRRLREQQVALAAQAASPRQVVIELLHGRPAPLEHFRSLEQKLALLDTAVALSAGPAIIKVVTFLARTLAESVFFAQLASRPVAAKHYLKHLAVRGDHARVQHVAAAMHMDKVADAAALRVVLCEKDATSRHRAILDMLRELDRRQRPTEDAKAYSDLLQMQAAIEDHDARVEQEGTNPLMVALPRKAGVPLTSAAATVYYCTLYHYSDPLDKPGSLQAVQKLVQLSEKQYLHTVLRALAHRQAWDEIDKLCTVKTMFRSVKLQPKIGAKALVHMLTAAKAPAEMLVKYLELVTDAEHKLALAMACHCHSAAVDALIDIRDKDRLRSYGLRPDVSNDAGLSTRIYSAMQNTSIKWR